MVVVLIVLGVESTAHTLGIGIVDEKRILANERSVYIPKGEGIVPRKAADHHVECFQRTLSSSLKMAGVSLDDIDLFSFSQGPGIGTCLRVSCVASKYLSAKYSKPLIGVNHAYAHLKISELVTAFHSPLFLYISGGNTQLIVEEKGRFRVLGETLDISVGNLFDSFGRKLGLEYAHGSELEKLAEKGKHYIELPYTVKGMNFTFCGLLTHAERLIPKCRKEDLIFSLMETAFSMLCEATERALFASRKRSLVVCGGVAQNKRLQNMLLNICKEDKVKFGVAPSELNADNGAMIAYAGSLLFKKYGTKDCSYWKPIQDYRIEQIEDIHG